LGKIARTLANQLNWQASFTERAPQYDV